MSSKASDVNAPVRIVEGSQAQAIVESVSLAWDWNRLLRECPWATVYQTLTWVRTWYRGYGADFRPVLALDWEEGHELRGALALWYRSGDRLLTHAGDTTAQVQAWISRPGSSFLGRALRALADRYAGADLELTGVPTRADAGPPAPGRGIRVTRRAGPEYRVHDASRWAGGTVRGAARSGIYGLGDTGPLFLKVLRTRADVRSALTAATWFHDLRAGAETGHTPFRDDPRLQRCYLALADEDCVLGTALRRHQQVLAVQIGFRSRDRLHLGLVETAPAFARTGISALHVGALLDVLHSEGPSLLEVGPEVPRTGSEGESRVRAVYSAQLGGWNRLPPRISAAPHRAAPRAVCPLVDRFAGVPVSALVRKVLRRISRWWSARLEIQVFWLPLTSRQARAETGDLPDLLRRDHIPDLLTYRSGGPLGLSRQEFLRLSLQRLEAGSHVYTYVEQGKLFHVAWLNENQPSSLFDGYQRVKLPAGSAVLFDAFTDPAGRRRGLHGAAIRRRLTDARSAGAAYAFCGVAADNVRSRRNCERVGFTRHSSWLTVTRFGRVSRWGAPARTTATARAAQANGAGELRARRVDP